MQNRFLALLREQGSELHGNAHVAFGHQHVGLTGGPKTGRLIADMVSNTPTNADLSAFDPARYQ